MPVHVAIIYYSSTSNTYRLAQEIATGARGVGAEVRLLRVRELAPEENIQENPAWWAHYQATRQEPEATNADLEWADVIILGSPTRYGLPTAQLKQFIDQTGPLWAQGKLVNKVCSAFGTTSTLHGGQESTILALSNTFYHWGGIIVPPAYADSAQFESGTPYGTSFASANGQPPIPDAVVRAARFQGQRTVDIARRLKGE